MFKQVLLGAQAQFVLDLAFVLDDETHGFVLVDLNCRRRVRMSSPMLIVIVRVTFPAVPGFPIMVSSVSWPCPPEWVPLRRPVQ